MQAAGLRGGAPVLVELDEVRRGALVVRDELALAAEVLPLREKGARLYRLFLPKEVNEIQALECTSRQLLLNC